MVSLEVTMAMSKSYMHFTVWGSNDLSCQIQYIYLSVLMKLFTYLTYL